MKDVFFNLEQPKAMTGPISNTIMNLPSSQIDHQFDILNDLSTKALLATGNQTFAKGRIRNLTLRLMHKLRNKKDLDYFEKT